MLRIDVFLLTLLVLVAISAASVVAVRVEAE